MDSDYADLITPLLHCDTLTEWEYDFVHDISEQDYLTDRQAEVLERIYHKQEDFI